MTYTAEDLTLVLADLADARRRWNEVRHSSTAEAWQYREAYEWMHSAEELVARVRKGLGEQNIRDATEVLGARVIKLERKR